MLCKYVVDKHSEKKRDCCLLVIGICSSCVFCGYTFNVLPNLYLSWVPENVQDLWSQEELGALAPLRSKALLQGRTDEGVEVLRAAAGAVRMRRYALLFQVAHAQRILTKRSYQWVASLFWKKSPVPGSWCCRHPSCAPQGSVLLPEVFLEWLRDVMELPPSEEPSIPVQITPRACQPLYCSAVWNYSSLTLWSFP